MKNTIFITGTGTEVGKTIVTAGLLRALRGRGIDAVTMKPVQTGATPVGGTLEAPDLRAHWDAAGWRPEPDEAGMMAPYCYEPACSPHLAGHLSGRYPSIPRIVGNAQILLDRHDALLIEGAGGIMVPLDETQTNVDLMIALDAPVLVVAHRGLGTINHTLLSLHVLRDTGLRVLGVVFNETQDLQPDFVRQNNPAAVAAYGEVDVLGNVDFLGEGEPDWQRFEACMPGLDVIQRALTER
jgi:dethiobiotin synthase